MKTKYIVLLVIAVFIALYLVMNAYHAGPWRGRVIDAETKQPIEGAAVVAVWQKVFRLDPTGASYDFLDATETVTDKDGRFEITSRWFIAIPMIRIIQEPLFTIYKPGYGTFPRYQVSPTVLSDGLFAGSVSVVELPRLVDKEERLHSLHEAESIIGDFPNRKISKLIELTNKENIWFGFEPYKEGK